MISLNATKDPTGKLDPQPWLSAPETNAVMDALAAGEVEARFVGGCVRNAISKRNVADIDIATPEMPDKVVERLNAAGIRSIPTGIEHGTVTAVVGDKSFEITTLRRDLETDGRRAVIAYTDDWIVDSSRRDFTINALSANRDGDVYDYHDGISDLAHGRIRFIGRAEDRVTEDYLRILRYFRFFAHFGRHPYDSAAFNACRRFAEKLKDISAERIQKELLGILDANEPADVFIMMREAHVLDVILPEATEIGTLRAAAWLAHRGIVLEGFAPDPIRRLGSVLAPDADGATVAQRLKLSNRDIVRISNMLTLAPSLPTPPSISDTRRIVYSHGNEAAVDASVRAWARRLADIAKLPADETADRAKLLEVALSWNAPSLSIGGKDAAALGLKEGPEMGNAIRAVENWWIDGDFQASRNECLEKLKNVVNGSSGENE